MTLFLAFDFYSHRHPVDCCGYFTIWRVIQRRRTSCMKKWSPSSGLLEILPQRALQNWLTWRLVSKRACGNERVTFVSFYISRFNRESQKSDLLTTLPVIQQFISWPWACGVGEGGHWLNYLKWAAPLPILVIFELQAKPFIWKCVPPTGSFSCKLIFIWNASHEDAV